jgi:hypothetical protein
MKSKMEKLRTSAGTKALGALKDCRSRESKPPVFVETRCERWAALWRSIHGEHFLFENYQPALFRTRRAAQAYIEERYGYIRARPDLRSNPHGWRMPKAVRVTVSVRGKR